MKQSYEGIKKQLDKVQFREIWPGFTQKPFALYDDTRACMDGQLIARPDNFRGNTAAEYKGMGIAIWKMTEGEYRLPPEKMAANLVHEMYHVYQKECGEQRFPNDLAMLCYPDNVENYAIKYRENCLLAEACRQEEQRTVKQLLAAFCSLRNYRKKNIGEYLEHEGRAETVEGQAEYAGICALMMLAPKLAEEKKREYLQLLENLSPMLFDVRRISYFTGTIMAMAAKKAGITIEHPLGEESRSLYEIIQSRLDVIPPKVDPRNLETEKIGNMLREQVAEKERKVAEFFSTERTRVEGEFRICGYDPMNMISSGNKILGTHFFMLYDEKTEQMITLEKASALQVKEGTTNRVTEYWV